MKKISSKAIEDETKDQLLDKREELIQHDAELASYLVLVRQAEDYVENFQPSECPVCEHAIDPATLLLALTARTESDDESAQLAAALAAVDSRLGGRLVKHSRYYWLLLAESHLTRHLFGSMLQRIWALPVPTG